MKKSLVVLYFLAGGVPTEEDRAISDDIKGTVRFRNGKFVSATDAPEACDYIAGHITEDIAKAYAKTKRLENAIFEDGSDAAKVARQTERKAKAEAPKHGMRPPKAPPLVPAAPAAPPSPPAPRKA